MKMKQVLIAEYSQLMHEILQRVLNKIDNLSVLDVAPSLDELAETIGQYSVDLLILPLNRPQRKWRKVYRKLLKEFPDLSILGISSDSNRIKLYQMKMKSESLADVNLKNVVNLLDQNLKENVSLDPQILLPSDNDGRTKQTERK